ncbi:hypothetical protein C8R43DRAFT_872132 [Mycena crocata]|nr:hypothetical protein C8R43DRAFT_872132 [Mycena crocata]
MDSNGSRAHLNKPEAGLSEWASKIKDMHRQTDGNEEAEQKRLEEEIAASRLARLRRSHGLGSGSRTNSLDLSKNKEYSSALRSEDTTTTDVIKPLAERQQTQTEALNKLMGSASASQPASATKPEPMSLAAFMGGKATGPRLNRHAPQLDAHDPTQFVQRTRGNAPHPIFGRGGIAMPGMARASSSREPDQTTTPSWSRSARTPDPSDRRRSTPSPEKPESPPVSPQRSSVRERTMSTPTGTITSKNGPVRAAQPTSTFQSRSYAPANLPNPSPVPSSSRPFTPRQQASPSSPPLPKSPVVTPSLARPIQPDPRTSPHGPQISASQSPSLAFLRSPPQKDPTPSLSRLQGRGFVQNMVKVSSQLDSPTLSPSAHSEKNRPVSGRKTSVLDRWPSPAVSPPPSPTATPIRRSRTVESPAPTAPSSVQPEQMSKSYSDTGRKPEGAVPRAERVPGLGSASTMVVIQPKAYVDEHGYKRGDSSRLSKGTTLPEPTKPLIHPTKDRAKKPKKNKSQASENVQSSTLQSSSPPTTSSMRTPLPSGTGGVVDRKAPEIKQPPSTIALQASFTPHVSPSLPTFGGGGSEMIGRRALPGMTQPHVTSSAPKPVATSALQPEIDDIHSYSPAVHTRTPSAGSRPTAMDVAQALADPPRKLSPTPPVVPSPAEEKSVGSSSAPTPRPRNMMPPSAQSEKRKSSYERYSMILPPLKEEATPDPTPVSTLTLLLAPRLSRSRRPFKAHVDEPLPRVDVSPVISRYSPPDPNKDAQTIQVDVMAIAGSTASPLGLTHIFYDTEILAVIHRSKSKSTGLINSTVWSWLGKSSRMGSAEERKLAELAKRYGTSIVPIQQLSEPPDLVQCLGGILAIRQGNRVHWANENTAMHIVRSLHGVIFIDQVDIDIRSLCSGFSCVVSILGLFVWHGCGSTTVERNAAMEYGRSLTSSPDEIVVLKENENDDDEMFWMALGDEAEYAKADYWKWRPSIAFTPQIWSVDASRKDALLPVSSFHNEQSSNTSVYIMDCIFEFFVLVPPGARGNRRDISLALSVAKDVATRLAPARPYAPNVHALVLPSQLPVDLRAQFRDLEETFLNDANAPEQMNILPFEECLLHLHTSSWNKSRLKDKTMLPLGLDDSHAA